VKSFLVGAGFDEIMRYSFYGEEAALCSGVPVADHLALENPMNPDQKYLRVGLSPGMHATVIENLHRFPSFDFFEFGRTYRAGAGGEIIEEKRIALACVAEESEKGAAFYRLKGAIENLFMHAHITGYSFDVVEPRSSLYHPGRTAEIRIGGEPVGAVGEANPTLLKRMGSRRGAFAEILFSAITDHGSDAIGAVPLPKYPGIERDLAFLVPARLPVADMMALFRREGGAYLKACEMFDAYENEEGRSIAFRLTFAADDRTLASAEVEDVVQHIVEQAEALLGARLRV
jgi:phenylalanyl-tRNA synthetase beta chain